MSYEILYNKQFLKTKDGKIIPVILRGSNNVWDILPNGKERRARNWSILRRDSKIDFTAEELLKQNEQWLEHEEVIVLNGKWINGKQWGNIIKRAVKEAKTIEELQPHERPVAYLSIWKGWENTTESKMYINTSEDLEDFIHMYYNRLENKGEGEKIYPCLDFRVEKFEHQKHNRQNKPKERLQRFYVIKFKLYNNQCYIDRITARKLSYCYSVDNAKQFKTEKEALKWLQDKNIEFRFKIKCEVERVG